MNDGRRRKWPGRAARIPLLALETSSKNEIPIKTLDKFPFTGNECALVEDLNQYTVEDLREAVYRVLFYNPPPTDAPPLKLAYIDKLRSHSIIGKTGHIERANAWSHIVAAMLFAIFLIVRPAVDTFDSESIAGQLSALSATASTVTFAVSSIFHILGTVTFLSPGLRLADHSAILLALGFAALADVALTTLNFHGIPAQAVADPLVAVMIMFLAGFYRRFVLEPEQTAISYGTCKSGLFRLSNSDGDWHSTRSSAYLVITFSGFLTIPVGVKNLGGDRMAILIATNFTSLVVLVSSMLLDSVITAPDYLYLQKEQRRESLDDIPCHSRRGGCAATSHFFWHVGSFVAVSVQLFGRELVLTQLKNT